MPGQLLRDFGMNARRCQHRDERMTERVEVGLLAARGLGLEEVALGSLFEFVRDGLNFLLNQRET